MDSSVTPVLTAREPDYPKGPGSSFRSVKKRLRPLKFGVPVGLLTADHQVATRKAGVLPPYREI